MRALDTLREISSALKTLEGSSSGVKEAEIMLRRGLNMSMVEIYRDNPSLDREQVRTVHAMLTRRLKGEPFQYISGREEFLGLTLALGPGVLIPRPETELVADLSIRLIRERARMEDSYSSASSVSVLDVCTGSGCLALTLASRFPHAAVFGSDISARAVEYARCNAELNGIENVTFLTGSLFSPLEKLPLSFDLIVSNPPYIATADIQRLSAGIRDWEPHAALDGGADGLDFYRVLIPEARHFLNTGADIVFECGDGQAGKIHDMLQQYGYASVGVTRDYAGIERIVNARWKK